jgi:multimeric flavodoxin WrbA
MKIKVLGLSGSPRHGNTEIMVLEALRSAKKEGVETEFIS